MKEILISISKKEVFDEVSLKTAYTGVKTEAEKGFYDRVATVEADKELLERLLTESFGALTDALREFIKRADFEEASIALTLEVSGSYDDTFTPSLKNDLFSAVAADVAQRWFRFSYAEKAEELKEEKNMFLKRAVSKLCHRSKPKRL